MPKDKLTYMYIYIYIYIRHRALCCDGVTGPLLFDIVFLLLLFAYQLTTIVSSWWFNCVFVIDVGLSINSDMLYFIMVIWLGMINIDGGMINSHKGG
jgi:hypothetical protein